jgi:hypothetical protein
MIGLLIWLLIVFVVLGVAWWVITLLPLPAPFPTIIQVVFVLIALIVVIDLLLHLGGMAAWPVLR